MTDDRFKIGRLDGRSNAEVLRDYVKDKPPGTVLSFAALEAALAAGSDREWDRAAVRDVVSSSLRTLATDLARVLQSVRGVGYRVARAADHRSIAMDRRRRADRQVARALVTLQNVRWDELDSESRKAHEGQLLVLQSLVQMQRGFDARLERVENAIQNYLGSKRKGKAAD